MSYQRKQEDNRRMKKITMDVTQGGPSGAYYRERDGQRKYLKRYGKSQGKNSCWAGNKKQARKTYRRFIKQNGYYTKKAYDLWGNVG